MRFSRGASRGYIHGGHRPNSFCFWEGEARLAGELDRHNALSILLRNVSLGLLLMAASSLIQFLISRTSLDILLSVFMLVLSLLILREAIKFRSLFYEGIYQTVLAYRMDLETAIKPAHSSGRRSNVGKG